MTIAKIFFHQKPNTMSYTLTSLSTKADCIVLLNIANAERDSLLYRKTGQQRQSHTAILTSMEIATSLATITAELDALEAILAALPPGPIYDENKVKKTKATYKKFLLEQRRGNYGPIALLEKEYTIACLDKDIVETDSFIAALAARRDELPS
jgi:hypothetical protein